MYKLAIDFTGHGAVRIVDGERVVCEAQLETTVDFNTPRPEVYEGAWVVRPASRRTGVLTIAGARYDHPRDGRERDVNATLDALAAFVCLDKVVPVTIVRGLVEWRFEAWPNIPSLSVRCDNHCTYTWPFVDVAPVLSTAHAPGDGPDRQDS